MFLKAVLGDELLVTDVHFHDKEVLPPDEDGKRIIYDVYCRMNVPPGKSRFKSHHLSREDNKKDVPHHFIIEMQNLYEPPFEDRIFYYISRLISSQGVSGWNYDLNPVISMTVTDFDFSFLTPKIMQDFRIMEKTTGELLTNKIRMLFFSLKQVPQEWEECKNEIQRLLYLIKNMDKLDKDAKPYVDGGYEELFDAAASSDLAAEDIIPYSQSLSRLRSYQAGVDYAAERSLQIGIERGRLQGLEEGKREEKEYMARTLMMMKMDDDFIVRATGLTLSAVQEIRKTLSM